MRERQKTDDVVYRILGPPSQQTKNNKNQKLLNESSDLHKKY